MAIRAHWEGIDELIRALDFMVVRVDEASRVATEDALVRVQRQTRTMLSLGWHPPGTRTGSIPPAPPWRISGELSRSVRPYGPVRAGPHAWEGKVGGQTVYARIQELGGITGRGHRTRLPARPYLKPAWEIVRSSVRGSFIKHWTEATH